MTILPRSIQICSPPLPPPPAAVHPSNSSSGIPSDPRLLNGPSHPCATRAQSGWLPLPASDTSLAAMATVPDGTEYFGSPLRTEFQSPPNRSCSYENPTPPACHLASFLR